MEVGDDGVKSLVGTGEDHQPRSVQVGDRAVDETGQREVFGVGKP